MRHSIFMVARASGCKAGPGTRQEVASRQLEERSEEVASRQSLARNEVKSKRPLWLAADNFFLLATSPPSG